MGQFNRILVDLEQAVIACRRAGISKGDMVATVHEAWDQDPSKVRHQSIWMRRGAVWGWGCTACPDYFELSDVRAHEHMGMRPVQGAA